MVGSFIQKQVITVVGYLIIIRCLVSNKVNVLTPGLVPEDEDELFLDSDDDD